MREAGELARFYTITGAVGGGYPQDDLGGWYSGLSQGYGFYQNDTFDLRYEELMVCLDNDERLALITQLQQILIDDAASIVYGYYNSRTFSRSDRVTGAEIATIDYYWITTDIAPVA